MPKTSPDCNCSQLPGRGLRGLILRHLRKPTKTNSDRSKIDFLLVQYFALCAPAKIYHKQIELADVAHVMGIQSDLAAVCSITLGTNDVTPMEMTDAFAVKRRPRWRST